MTGKGKEVSDMMKRRNVDMLCVQETKWKGSKTRNIGFGLKLFYYGTGGKRNSVGVILKEEYSKSVVEVKRVSDRVMNVKLEVEGVMINVISAYASQVGYQMEEKEKFWIELNEVVEEVPRNKRLVIGADFNGHVGEGNRGDEQGSLPNVTLPIYPGLGPALRVAGVGSLTGDRTRASARIVSQRKMGCIHAHGLSLNAVCPSAMFAEEVKKVH
ncbi:hypothetical protein HF521_021782 [Silurus meridionalis]|uniref:Endonuclease/exonuclease/phosphatase domain-containing protein n=1 Tax=Silurus meridionalis TaxID=175797 RepID=A0A8T0BH19_SILME|nr:hypothetical protein HF521_021782 [Silurus meridionalis]